MMVSSDYPVWVTTGVRSGVVPGIPLMRVMGSSSVPESQRHRVEAPRENCFYVSTFFHI